MEGAQNGTWHLVLLTRWLFYLNLVKRLFSKVLGLWTGRWGCSKRAVQATFKCQLNHCIREKTNSRSLGWWPSVLQQTSQRSRQSRSCLAHTPAVCKVMPSATGFLVFPHVQERKLSTRMTQASGRQPEESSALKIQCQRGNPRLILQI